jgi:hypothetical protein
MDDLTGWTLFGWTLSPSLVEIRFFDFRPSGSLMRNAVVAVSGPSLVRFDQIQSPGDGAENHRVIMMNVNDKGQDNADFNVTLMNGGTIIVEGRAVKQIIW